MPRMTEICLLPINFFSICFRDCPFTEDQLILVLFFHVRHEFICYVLQHLPFLNGQPGQSRNQASSKVRSSRQKITEKR